MYSSVDYFLLEGGTGDPCEGVIFTVVAGTGLRPLSVSGFKQMMPVANSCEPVRAGV
ncbi:MAG: hypothetical protein QW584_02130 [Thermofilaceae archaeon]